MSDSSYPRICDPNQTEKLEPAGVPAICQPLTTAFEAATGWVLDFEESRSSYRRRKSERLPESAANGRLEITDLSAQLPPGKPAASREHCDSLAAAINSLYNQVQQYRDELRLAQTNLAAPGRLALSADRTEKLNRLLTQLLQTACSQFGYESAAIMVLDEPTTMLVQRVGFGPHYSHSNGNGRLLGESRADVEALSGGVVVLNKRSEVVSWQAPVSSRAAVCIPIASLDNLHGTLWLAGETKRELSDSDTNLLEIIAGRIAAELEMAALTTHAEAAGLTPAGSDSPAPATIEESESEQLVQPPFEGWALDRPVNSKSKSNLQSLALCQVDTGENLQLLIACSSHASGAAELRRAKEAFAVLRGLELDASQLFNTLDGFLCSESACEPDIRFICIKIDPLSGEFESHGHPEVRAQLALAGQLDTCTKSRRFGFLTQESQLRVSCTACATDLLVVRRK
jgi:hypothetical protein